MDVDEEIWMSAVEAAERAGVSRPRIHQLVKESALEGRREEGRLLVGERSLRAWADRKGRTLRTPPPTMEALRKRKERIWALARRRGVRSLSVFGSVARGEADENSDVDFLVELEEGHGVLDVSGLILDLTEELGRPVDVVTARIQSPSTARVRREAVPL